MSTKAIYEAAGKKLLNKYLGSTASECRCVNIDANTDWKDLVDKNRWLENEVLVNRLEIRSFDKRRFSAAFGRQT